MIRFENIEKSFDGRQILKSVTFSAGAGETLCLFAPSGWGKSTILNIAAGIIRPDNGSMKRSSDRIGYSFQKDLLLPWKDAAGNLRYILEGRYTKADSAKRAHVWLELVGLGGEENKFPGEMSGGMRKRLSIARAMCIEPDILLLDEPFAYLDRDNIILAQKLLTEDARQRQRATIIVTHTREHATELGCRIIDITERPIVIR